MGVLRMGRKGRKWVVDAGLADVYSFYKRGRTLCSLTFGAIATSVTYYGLKGIKR